jgi:hypothetical protein
MQDVYTARPRTKERNRNHTHSVRAAILFTDQSLRLAALYEYTKYSHIHTSRVAFLTVVISRIHHRAKALCDSSLLFSILEIPRLAESLSNLRLEPSTGA